MRYVITGGAGFIGSSTVDALLARGHEVVVLDDFSADTEHNLQHVTDKITVIRGTVTDLPIVRHAIAGADYVIHLAARMSVSRSVQEPLETNHINVDGTLNVLLAARDAKVRRVVYASSVSVYGDSPAQPKSEAMCPAPISPYGVSKYIGELYANAFGHCYGLEIVCLRYFNVFGPRQDPQSPYSGVISQFITKILQGNQPVVFGDGEQSRDFTHVADVVQANLLACDALNSAGRVFNVGTGNRFTLNDTLRLLANISGKNISPIYDLPYHGDIPHAYADISDARKTLGYDPKISFEEGLRSTWNWARANMLR